MNFQEYKHMLHDWALEQTPVFIVGPERSGTSLLFQQVSNHPAFADFKDATVETFCFIKPWFLLEEGSIDNYEMRVYLGQKKLKPFQQSIKPLLKRNEALSTEGLSKAYLYESNRQEIWRERRYKHILRAFFHHSWINLNQRRLVEKTPAHIRCLKEIFDTFPNARILVCVRAIPEIIASHRKRLEKELALGKQKDDPSIAWLCHSTEDFLNYLKHINFLIDTWQEKRPEQLRIVPYSKLTANPTEELADIYHFLGEDYHAPKSRKAYSKAQAWDPLLNKPPQSNTINIKQYLDESELSIIEEHSDEFSEFWK